MSFRRIAILTALAAGLLTAAAAEAAYTTGAVNLRAGPGTRYPVITTAPPGAFVRVRNCGGSWCKVNYRGIAGWMSASYISDGGPRYYYPPRYIYRPPPPPPVYYYPRPYYYPYGYPRYWRPGPSWGVWFGFSG
ncbi:MAG TPA: SH3 domain-containing protein [Bauldia sp.]|nr:SH3 domain-containing protein [Bauldia sp.]